MLVMFLMLLGAAGGCPAPSCFCFATPEWLQCRYVRLEGPPSDLPGSVRNLSIVGGSLGVLGGAAFAGGWGSAGTPSRPLEHLELLLLTFDGIEALEDAAFAGLPALETLDLSHNPLRALGFRAFQDCCAQLRILRLNQALLAVPLPDLRNLSALSRLELSGNRLRAIPASALLPPSLAELDVRNNSIQAPRPQNPDGPRIQLAPNPLRCDCASLRPFLSWLRNVSVLRAPDALALRCAAPQALAGTLLGRLRPSQLLCPPDLGDQDWAHLLAPEGPADRLETASYVFFGLVLALIGLVFLMVLYLNRKGIKRWLSNLRDACRDQMEGYHYRYEQDSDPRRASPGGL